MRSAPARLLAAGKEAADPFKLDRAVERAGWDRERRVELVQVPTQPLLAAAALVDEVVAMDHQQLELAQSRLARPGRSSSGSRSAALAAASASIASDLPRLRPARRSGAVSLGGTRTSRSLAATS